jgi:hypothetical protein
MMPTIARKYWLITVPLLLVTVLATVVIASPRARCALRIAPEYSEFPSDARIYYVPGSESVAQRFADVLPEAIDRIETRLGLPLKPGFRIYVCPTHEGFARQTGQSPATPVRGLAFPRDIWVSPKALDFSGRDTALETLAHELAHLHLVQHIGWLGRTRQVPAWFGEGLADFASGTGYDVMQEQEALSRIRAGRVLRPDEKGHLPFPKRPSDYGLTWPEFHAQSRMLVEHLNNGRSHVFSAFLSDIMSGRSFGVAFRDRFGVSPQEEWITFLSSHGVHIARDDKAGA